MAQRGKIKHYANAIGIGNNCIHCGTPMERRKRMKMPTNRSSYYYSEWDYCSSCSHVQHYEEFKSYDFSKFEVRTLEDEWSSLTNVIRAHEVCTSCEG